MLLWLAVVFVPVKNVDGAGLLPLCMLFSLSIFAFFTFFFIFNNHCFYDVCFFNLNAYELEKQLGKTDFLKVKTCSMFLHPISDAYASVLPYFFT